MIDFKEYFGCKYPIICLPMNQVSDINLALAVQSAGAFPSIPIFNFFKNGHLDKKFYLNELVRFKDNCNSGLMLSVSPEIFLNEQIMHLFFYLGFRHVKIYHTMNSQNDVWANIQTKIGQYKISYNAMVLQKLRKPILHVITDTVVLKGAEAAGRKYEDTLPTKENFLLFRNSHPNINLIPSGGIHSSEQVNFYMNNGALAVGIGSLFAISKESKVSPEVKNKILRSTLSDISTRGPLNLQGVFSDLEKDDDNNLTRTLSVGIKDPSKGGIFMGHAIDHITEILSVKDIVKNLIQE